MGNIVDFNELKKNSKNEKLDELIKKSYNDIKKFETKNKELLDDNFKILYDFLKELYLNENKRLLSSKLIDRFISNFDKVTYDEDDSNKEYFYLAFKSKGKIFINDDEYLSVILKSFCEMDEINPKSYLDIANTLSNTGIKKIINNEKKDKKVLMVDIIDALNNGKNILDIYLIYNDDNKDDMELSIYIIDNIHNYYLNQIAFFYDKIDQHIVDNIDSILLIKTYSDDIKYKFIQLVIKIRSISNTLIKEISLLSDLVDIIFSFSDDLEKIDKETMESMLSLKNINNIDIDDLEKIYKKDENNGGMKL